MEITSAKRVIELSKDNRRILVTLWDGDKISSCVTEETKEAPAQSRCETCQGDDEFCNQYVEHLRGQGYQVNEVELGELEIEESLPEFLKKRQPTMDDEERYFTEP